MKFTTEQIIKLIRVAGSVVNIQDNENAVELLQETRPQWIDDMPMAASHRTEGSTIVQRCAWNHVKLFGIFAVFFGAGCDETNNGWSLIFFHADTEESFKRKVDALMDGFSAAAH